MFTLENQTMISYTLTNKTFLYSARIATPIISLFLMFFQVIVVYYVFDSIGDIKFVDAIVVILILTLLTFFIYYQLSIIFRSKHIIMNSDGFHFNNKTIPWENISKININFKYFTIVYKRKNKNKKTVGIWGFPHESSRSRELIQLYASKNHTYVVKGIFNF